MGMPFVAVIGGLRNLEANDVSAAKAAGKSIGKELADSGFGLVVYFSNDESLEPHVVSGYVEALGNKTGAIRVRYAQSQRGQVRFAEEATRPELFEHRLFPSEDWEAPFYRSLAEREGVDGVLLLAGARSTLIAGQIAMARRLPILAVDAFGGAAAKIWNDLASALPGNNLTAWGMKPASHVVSELKDACLAIASANQQVQRREQMLKALESQNRKVTYTIGAFALLLAAMYVGMFTSMFSFYPFMVIAGLIAAGATGALVRTVLSTPSETDPWTSFTLGGIAGFVVGLAYLIPQFVGAPEVLSPSGLENEMTRSTARIQFFSAVLVAISAGVGFDTVFSRLREEVKNRPVSPP